MIRKYILWAVILAGGMIPLLTAQTRPGASGPSPLRKRIQTAVVEDVQFFSSSLQREMTYRIVLPRGYRQKVQRYPVLYLLHGLKGSYGDWETHTHLVQDLDGLDVIVVMPDGRDAWYSNSTSDPKQRFEDYIVKDLVEEVDARYRTLASAHGRAIAGLSMGGYGAVKLALKYPQMFSFAGTFSGALNAATNLDLSYLPERYQNEWSTIFGAPDSSMRVENDPFKLVESADPPALPYFYLDCGQSDRFLKMNRDFVASLAEHKVPYEYHEVPGAHTWKYWNDRLPDMLRALATRMDLQKKPN